MCIPAGMGSDFKPRPDSLPTASADLENVEKHPPDEGGMSAEEDAARHLVRSVFRRVTSEPAEPGNESFSHNEQHLPETTQLMQQTPGAPLAVDASEADRHAEPPGSSCGTRQPSMKVSLA